MGRGFNMGGGSVIIGGDATPADILINKTAYVKGQLVTGEIPIQSATSITPAATQQIAVNTGTYVNGDITCAAIPNQKGATTITPTASAQTAANAGTYMTGALTLAAIPNQKAATTITPATTQQTAAAAGTYMTGTLTCGAIPNQTTGGTKYATTSAQTILAANKYLSSDLKIGALSQSNLAAANIVSGKTITISNGSTNVWSVTGTAQLLKMKYASFTVTDSTPTKNFYFSSGNYSTEYVATINPGFTPVYAIIVGPYNREGLTYGIRESATQWRIYFPFRDYNDFLINNNLNSAWRWTSTAVDIPVRIGDNTKTAEIWCFGY